MYRVWLVLHQDDGYGTLKIVKLVFPFPLVFFPSPYTYPFSPPFFELMFRFSLNLGETWIGSNSSCIRMMDNCTLKIVKLVFPFPLVSFFFFPHELMFSFPFWFIVLASSYEIMVFGEELVEEILPITFFLTSFQIFNIWSFSLEECSFCFLFLIGNSRIIFREDDRGHTKRSYWKRNGKCITVISHTLTKENYEEAKKSTTADLLM